MTEVSVVDNPEKQRFEAWRGDDLAGFAAYESAPGLVVFTHTEVAEELEGHGVGGALARAALDDVRRRGGTFVDPRCPFIRDWIERHPDYQDLLAAR